MADKKFKYVPFVTEVMTARHPKLSEPDTDGEYGDGKYKTEAIANSIYTATLQQAILSVARACFGCRKNVYLPWREIKQGTIAFNFKSPKKKPELFDAKGNPLKPGVIILGGSLVRIGGVIAAWEKGSKRGVSLWPDAIRLIKLSEGFDAAKAFGPPEKGYDGSSPTT